MEASSPSAFACDLCQRLLSDFYWLDTDDGVFCVCFNCFVDNMQEEDDPVPDVQDGSDGVGE